LSVRIEIRGSINRYDANAFLLLIQFCEDPAVSGEIESWYGRIRSYQMINNQGASNQTSRVIARAHGSIGSKITLLLYSFGEVLL